MDIQWKTAEIGKWARSGIIYFTSKMEMLEDVPCKMYKLLRQHSLTHHCHDYFQIWYVAKGNFQHTVSNRRFDIGKGDIFVISPFTVHRIEIPPDQDIEVYGCEFMPSFINERFDEKPVAPLFFDVAYLEYFLRRDDSMQSKITLGHVAEIRVLNVLKEMLAEYQRRSPFFQMVLKSHLLLLLSILVREINKDVVQAGFEKEEKYRSIMTGVIDYIHAAYHEDLHLNTLCSLSNLSRSTFCSVFKTWTGKTFNRYLADLRMFHALTMLKQPELSVTDVCYAIGFNELSYFCRMFKKYTGISPTSYRKQAIQQEPCTHTIIPLLHTNLK
ncbi:AraC family transcriptional regulator [Paenibacillus alvei]|uniref:helix-turn-helix domain-containing protein n=1 Tax=Paenibacillus alvei TaxID=44250 RepID=UPI003D2AF3A6